MVSSGADVRTVAPTFPFTGLAPAEIFAVEDDRAQLVWRDLPNGAVGVRIGDREEVVGDGPTGAAELVGLPPDTATPIDVLVDGRPVASVTAVTTPALAGPELVRVATISDLHLGEHGFGLVKEMREPDDGRAPYPLRCATAAVAEAEAWGADLLVVKGDITHSGRPDQWEAFDALLATTSIPVIAIPGNHDTFAKPGSSDAAAELRRRDLFPSAVHSLDRAGVRFVAADTTTPRHTWGRIRHLHDDLVEAVDVPGPALLFVHHHLETHAYPRLWPLGTPRRHAGAVLDALVEANPDLLLSSGHTHRNRMRTHGPATVTEVGSTKDHPGVWAGYVVHRSGIRQVVRRVAAPDCIEWTERTRAVVGGIWGRWSPGRLPDRSFLRRWTTDTRRSLESSAQASSASV